MIDKIEESFEGCFAELFSMMGYNLTFLVHKRGCILISASTPIGATLTANLCNDGFVVFAAVDQLSDVHAITAHISLKNQHNLMPLVLDSTNAKSIKNALHVISVHLDLHDDMLIAVINCGGTKSMVGPLETISGQDYLNILNVNTVGPLSIINSFLPLLRNSGGRIVNFSSLNTMTASPFNGVYVSSKLALESATDTLRNEVYTFGISVSLIILGNNDISSHSSSVQNGSQTAYSPLYTPLSEAVSFLEDVKSNGKLTTAMVSRVLNHALFSAHPKTKYLVGLDAKATKWIRLFLSDRVLDWVYQSLIHRFTSEMDPQ